MTDLPTARTRPASNWSAIWVLPLIALLIGIWLVWRAYSQAGIDIQVVFPSGEGIQAGKTEVIYKGMAIGKVTWRNVAQRPAPRSLDASTSVRSIRSRVTYNGKTISGR